MTLKEFITKWDGKLCDYDGAYGAQCVDLYRQYCKEVLEVPQSPPVIGAKDIWDNYVKELVAFNNTPEGIPVEGDIVIWGSGTYGHVAIFIEGDVNRFISFDQNYPDGTSCHKQVHSYSGVLGWLRKRCIIEPSIPVINDQTKIPGIDNKEVQQIRSEMLAKDNEITSLRLSISSLNTKVTELEAFVELLQKQLEPISDPYPPIVDSHTTPSSLSRLWTRIKNLFGLNLEL